MNKKREYMQDRINKVVISSKNKNNTDLYRGLTEFKKGYQPESN
jgi:hypothetical protein